MIFRALRRWMGHGENGSGEMISCEDALSRIYEFLDGELDDLSNEQVEAHFAVCRRCYPHLASERSFRAALNRAFAGRAAPEELRARVLELLQGDEGGS